MFGTLGVQEMIIIFLVALVLFGPKKLPELGKTIGKALTEFRRASNDLKATFEREMHTLERESESLHQAASSTANQIADSATRSNLQIANVDPYQHWADPESAIQPPAQSVPQVGAPEVPDAESQPATEHSLENAAEHVAETPKIEGTVARTETTHPEIPSDHVAAETHQHS